MFDIKKYPRTQHVRGSNLQHGDHDLNEIDWEEISDKNLIIEEKIDGSNCGISFSNNGDLNLQSRGHYLRGGPREKHFNLLKQWASVHIDSLFSILEDRYVMYGEWMFAKHTCFYDALPHYFMEFDIFDRKNDEYLDSIRRKEMLLNSPITSVLILHNGGQVDSFKSMMNMISRSNFITSSRNDNLIKSAKDANVDPDFVISHTDMNPNMEGLYIKWEEDGIVKGRYKFVRDSFTSSILDQETHWHDRTIVQNKLLPGAFEKMFNIGQQL